VTYPLPALEAHPLSWPRMAPSVLLLPGLSDSGPDHWQSWWEREEPSFLRLRQRDWESPDRLEWIEVLDAAVSATGPGVVLVAHSAGGILVAAWAAASGRRVRGALLVGPSDTEAPSFPVGPTGWQPMPLQRLPFPAIVVASEDDRYVSVARARVFAGAWGARLVNAGRAGHLNSESGLGAWPAGRSLLTELLALPVPAGR